MCNYGSHSYNRHCIGANSGLYQTYPSGDTVCYGCQGFNRQFSKRDADIYYARDNQVFANTQITLKTAKSAKVLLKIEPNSENSDCSTEFVILQGNDYVKFEKLGKKNTLTATVDQLPDMFDVKALALSECTEKPISFQFLIDASLPDEEYWNSD